MPNDLRSTTRSKDTSGVHLWLVLWKATRAVGDAARLHVEGLGFCLSDFGVMEALLHKGPLPVNVLGAKVLLTSGSMTAAVDRLERRGFVRRDDDPNDRRARLVRLTPEGKKLIRQMFSSHEQVMESAVAGLTAKERATLTGLLRKLGLGAAGFAAPETGAGKPGKKSSRAVLDVRKSKRRRQ